MATNELVSECLECGHVIFSGKPPAECPECGEENWDVYAAKNYTPPKPKRFAVQFVDGEIRRWEYFPMEFTTERPARMHVLNTYGSVEILQVVEVKSYSDLVERYAKR